MTINRLSANRVLIILGKDDMKNFDLSYEALSLNDDRSRKTILRLLGLACQKEGLDPNAKRFRIEAMALDADCYILITLSHRTSKAYRLKSSAVHHCYNLGGSANFLEAICALNSQNVCCNKNSAYFLAGTYYLVFSYPVVPQKLRRVLSEFATRSRDKLIVSRLREFGTEVCATNAIAVIGNRL